jgi:hypothetical protein
MVVVVFLLYSESKKIYDDPLHLVAVECDPWLVSSNFSSTSRMGTLFFNLFHYV